MLLLEEKSGAQSTVEHTYFPSQSDIKITFRLLLPESQHNIRFSRAAGVKDDLIKSGQQAAGAVSLSGSTSGCLTTVSLYYEFTAAQPLFQRAGTQQAG
ncbi:hypothetical protein NQZ68_031306 [Dissostichus eleginoides]|nr:hypothetical protein NQZ68_031306 [Dissostichus eleginoides]